jgi:predicted nuclease of predicted toxin-antitoxin system
MKKHLIDANLPYYFSLWSGEEFIHMKDLNPEWPDERVWSYAKEHNLTIVTKDSDFSDRILISSPPPKIIHIRSGNLKLNQLYDQISNLWQEICNMSERYKLVNVFNDRIEGIE